MPTMRKSQATSRLPRIGRAPARHLHPKRIFIAQSYLGYAGPRTRDARNASKPVGPGENSGNVREAPLVQTKAEGQRRARHRATPIEVSTWLVAIAEFFNGLLAGSIRGPSSSIRMTRPVLQGHLGGR